MSNPVNMTMADPPSRSPRKLSPLMTPEGGHHRPLSLSLSAGGSSGDTGATKNEGALSRRRPFNSSTTASSTPHHHRSMSCRTRKYYAERGQNACGRSPVATDSTTGSRDGSLRRNRSAHGQHEGSKDVFAPPSFGPPSLDELFLSSMTSNKTKLSGSSMGSSGTPSPKAVNGHRVLAAGGSVAASTGLGKKRNRVPDVDKHEHQEEQQLLLKPDWQEARCYKEPDATERKVTPPAVETSPSQKVSDGSFFASTRRSSWSTAWKKPHENRVFTAYKFRTPWLNNPVAACWLPNDCFAIADYDNGFVVTTSDGDLIYHFKSIDDRNACDVAATLIGQGRTRSSTGDASSTATPTTDLGASTLSLAGPPTAVKLFVLLVKHGDWTINTYLSPLLEPPSFSRSETIVCPKYAYIENWALRKIAVTMNYLYLLACGEARCCVWLYNTETPSKSSKHAPPIRRNSKLITDPRLGPAWKTIVCEIAKSVKPTLNSLLKSTFRTSGSVGLRSLGAFDQQELAGTYNDISVVTDGATGEMILLLCDRRRSCLTTMTVKTATGELVDQHTTYIRRIHGLEWVVQGPSLAAIDERQDILVYDTSGKLFLFDGESCKCKRIVADIGQSEAGAIFVRDGWVYVLFRGRLTVEAYRYYEESGNVADGDARADGKKETVAEVVS